MIDGYKLYHRDRGNNSRAGGVVVYISESLPAIRRNDLERANIEGIWTEILQPHAKGILLGTIYLYMSTIYMSGAKSHRRKESVKEEVLPLEGEKLSVDKLRRKINRYTATVEELTNVLNQFYKDISNLNEDKSTLQGKLDEMERSSVSGKNKALTPNSGENCRKLGKSKKT